MKNYENYSCITLGSFCCKKSIYNFPFKMPFFYQSVKGKSTLQLKCVLIFHGLPHEAW